MSIYKGKKGEKMNSRIEIRRMALDYAVDYSKSVAELVSNAEIVEKYIKSKPEPEEGEEEQK